MWSSAAFHADAVDNVTIGISSLKLYVKGLSIDTAQLTDGAVELAKMADNSVDSDQYVDGSIDLAHLSGNSVDGTKIAAGAIESGHLHVSFISAQTEFTGTPLDTDSILMWDASANLNKEVSLLTLAKHAAFPKAYGRISGANTIATGDLNADEAYNCTCTAVTGDYTYTITLDTAMGSVEYAVIAQDHYSDYWGYTYRSSAIEVINSSTFKIHKGQGGSNNPAGALTDLSFAVFGTLVPSA
jgi:hypothetical protein